MSAGKRYLLDANVFIQAHQSYYAMSICPGFWTALLRQHDLGRVFSIDRIRAELSAQQDELREWVEQRAPESFFKKTQDKRVSDTFTNLMNWVQSEGQFTPAAKAEFAGSPDGWVIAYARVNALIVVSHEVFAPGVKRKVPIPNVCLEFDVDYCDTFQMLRDLNVEFILKKRRSPRRKR